MRRSWKAITLLGGVLFLGVSLLMIAATTWQSPAPTDDGSLSEGIAGAVREYRDQQLAVRFYYPSGWQSRDNSEGVTILPEEGVADLMEQGAIFVIARSTDNATLPPLSPMLQQVIESDHAVRASENVAVGGMSGTETVVELDRATADAAPNAQIASALRSGTSPRLTVIVWQSERDNEPIWVIMADARAGDYLATLQEIRNSIQWE